MLTRLRIIFLLFVRVNYSFSPCHKHWLSTLLSSLLQAVKAKLTFHVGASKHLALLFSPPQTFLLFSTYYFPFITSTITSMFWIKFFFCCGFFFVSLITFKSIYMDTHENDMQESKIHEFCKEFLSSEKFNSMFLMTFLQY
jgi:hypothetical protein